MYILLYWCAAHIDMSSKLTLKYMLYYILNLIINIFNSEIASDIGYNLLSVMLIMLYCLQILFVFCEYFCC